MRVLLTLCLVALAPGAQALLADDVGGELEASDTALLTSDVSGGVNATQEANRTQGTHFGFDPERGPNCLADEVPANAPEHAVGAMGEEIPRRKTSADPNVTVVDPTVVATQNRTCTHPVAPASAADGTGGQPGEISDATDAEERLPQSPASGPSPQDEVLDEVSSRYAEVAKTGQMYTDVPLPEDPTRPQDAGIEDHFVEKKTSDYLDGPSDHTSEVHHRRASAPAPSNGTAAEPLGGADPSNARPSAAVPAGPEPSDPPSPSEAHPFSPLAFGDTDTTWNPNAAQTVVIIAAVSGALALILGFIASHLRSGSSILRRAAHGIPLLSMLVRIKSHKAIEDPKRRALYHAIHDNPGISNKELCEAVGMSRRNVEHHLIVVSRAGLIVSESIGRGRHYYPAAANLDRKQRRACTLLRIERNREVLQAIQQNPGMTLTHLIETRGLHASGAHRVLNSLHEAGLVQRSRVGTVGAVPSRERERLNRASAHPRCRCIHIAFDDDAMDRHEPVADHTKTVHACDRRRHSGRPHLDPHAASLPLSRFGT